MFYIIRNMFTSCTSSLESAETSICHNKCDTTGLVFYIQFASEKFLFCFYVKQKKGSTYFLINKSNPESSTTFTYVELVET